MSLLKGTRIVLKCIYIGFSLVCFPLVLLLCFLLLPLYALCRVTDQLLSRCYPFGRSTESLPTCASDVNTKLRRRAKVRLRKHYNKNRKRIARRGRHLLLSISPQVRKIMSWIPVAIAALQFFILGCGCYVLGGVAVGVLRLCLDLFWLLVCLSRLCGTLFLLHLLRIFLILLIGARYRSVALCSEHYTAMFCLSWLLASGHVPGTPTRHWFVVFSPCYYYLSLAELRLLPLRSPSLSHRLWNGCVPGLACYPARSNITVSHGITPRLLASSPLSETLPAPHIAFSRIMFCAMCGIVG